MFSLILWGESVLFTVLTKERSRCSFDVGIHSTVSSILKFGEDVTGLQPKAYGRESMIKSMIKNIFCILKSIFFMLKSRIPAGFCSIVAS